MFCHNIVDIIESIDEGTLIHEFRRIEMIQEFLLHRLSQVKVSKMLSANAKSVLDLALALKAATGTGLEFLSLTYIRSSGVRFLSMVQTE